MNKQLIETLESLLAYVDQFGTHTSDKRVTEARLQLSLAKQLAGASGPVRLICENTLTDNLCKRDDTLTPRPDSREVYGDGE